MQKTSTFGWFARTHPESQFGTETDVVGRRMGAFFVDSVVVFAVFYAGIRVFGNDPGVGTPAVVLGFFLWFVFSVFGFTPLLVLYGFSPRWYFTAVAIWAVYGTVAEGAFGQTPGKRFFDIVVTNEEGEPCSVRAAGTRNLLRVVDGLFFYGLGLMVLAVTTRRQRLGDLLADTVVVRRSS